MEVYKDSRKTPEERAKDLLSRMSIDEKMAQLNSVSVEYAESERSMHCGIGEVVTLNMRSIRSLEEAAAWQRDTQKKVMENSAHGIPAIFHMEGLCGAFIQDAASFPSGIARGASWDVSLEEEIASTVSRQERTLGITHILAPVLDVSRDSRMGRQGETYGEDPTLCAAMGAAYTKGIQKDDGSGLKAEAVAKHFLGFHNSQGGIHGANSDTPPRLLQEIYGKPFQAAITEAGLKGIMPCYCAINGRPASASGELLTKLLREEMGFDGVVLADYCAVGNVHTVQNLYDSLAEAGLRCMEAGIDVELPFCMGFNEELKEWFESGKADMALLDRAVLRVLEAKFRMGLFERPFALTGEELKRNFCQPKDRQRSLASALKSLVLLKNDSTLPIKEEVKKIAVVGCHAKNARFFFGGYTHLSMEESVYAASNAMAGVGDDSTEAVCTVTIPGTQIQSDEADVFDEILRAQKPECKNLLEELRSQLPDVEIRYAYGYPIAGNDMSHHEEALRLIRDADLCIMTLGGKNGSNSLSSMGEGIDSTDINLPICQEEFIKKAAACGTPMVGVHFNGRPISSDAADELLNAILEAWNPSEMGAEAIVDTLTGKNNPSGKLPVSVAYHAGQIPVYYNHPNGSSYHQARGVGFQNYVNMSHTPRYFFGHGLSYTSFAYSGLTIDKKEVAPDETVSISIEIENTGNVPGVEIVQLYLKDRLASMIRPVMELGGFARVALKSGEKKRITFLVEPSFMAFLDIDMRWKIEKGHFDVKIGASSEDIRCEGSFYVVDDLFIEGKKRAFCCSVLQEKSKM